MNMPSETFRERLAAAIERIRARGEFPRVRTLCAEMGRRTLTSQELRIRHELLAERGLRLRQNRGGPRHQDPSPEEIAAECRKIREEIGIPIVPNLD